MLQVDARTQELFLSDSVPKNLTIEVDNTLSKNDIKNTNMYFGDIKDDVESVISVSKLAINTYTSDFIVNKKDNSTRLKNYQVSDYIDDFAYIYISFDAYISKNDGCVLADRLRFNCPCGKENSDGSNSYFTYYSMIYEFNTSDLVGTSWDDSKTISICQKVYASDLAENIFGFGLIRISASSANIDSENFDVHIRNIQLRYTDTEETNLSYVAPSGTTKKEILKQLSYIDPVTNGNIIQESFSLTESLCSQQNLKFGLCESAHCEFEIVDRSEKFNGKTIRPYISALTLENFDYSGINFVLGSGTWYNTWNNTNLKSYGITLALDNNYFTYAKYIMLNFKFKISDIISLDSTAPPKFYIGIKVSTAKNYVRSIYITPSVATILGSNHVSIYNVQDAIDDYIDVYATVPTDLTSLYPEFAGDYIKSVNGLNFEFANADGTPNTISHNVNMITYVKELAVYIVNDINSLVPTYSEDSKTSLTIPDKIKGVPLGVFKITEVKKNHTHDIIKKSITAYDRMSILDQDVGDWLTRYMVITDTGNKRSSASPSFTKFGVEYVRQMFSTYVSLMIRLGILSQDDFPVKYVYKDENFNDVNAAGRYSFDFFYPCEIASGTLHETVGCTHALGDGWDEGSPSDEYFRVTVTPRDGKSDEELFNQYMGNLDDWPKSYIGFPNSACILAICEFIDGSIEKYLLNSGDIVYIKKGYKNLTFYIGAATGSFDPQSKFEPYNADSYIISHYKIESVYVPEDLKELINAHLRLVYYNYGTQSLGSFSSSVSGKDVVRSLLEINGCFFHMDRYGKPEIIYASKAGLYPSETLYPALDLYPRGMNGPLLSMGRYISMECDDYVVQKYGKIQIKTQSQVKSGESICSYEYIGDENAKNTYIIEDNIFYCAEGTVYEYGSQPEVDEMLKNLFLKIANLNYTPHTTKLRGLPFMECGDRVNLITLTGGIESFIFRRTLKGIHALMDTYEAEGDEYNEALNTFDYNVYKPQ